MITWSVFGSLPQQVVFASPVVGRPYVSALSSAMQALEGFLSSHQIACEALLVVNDSFREVVLDLIIALATDVADTSELFLRSNQLLRIFEPVVDFSVSRRALRGEPRDADGAEVLRFELDPSPPDAFKAKLLEKRWLE